jgi:FlgD Ig-like domain/Right handed beta helix region
VRQKAAFLIGLLIVFSAESPQATTLLIKPDGTGDYANIQDGLNAAAAGDTVLLAPGTYLAPPQGQIDWPGRSVMLLSQAGANETSIQGYKLFVLNVGADGSTIDGVTITLAPSYSNALFCNYRSITVRHCVFAYNSGGAVVRLEESGTTIENCVFLRNTSPGPSILCSEGASAIVRRCLFVENSFNSSGVVHHGAAITNNTFVRNMNQEIDPQNAVLNVRPGAMISYNIVAFTAGGKASHSDSRTGSAFFTCNDFFANEKGDGISGTDLGGNFSADPLFCTANAVDDLTIKAASPCAPEHSPCGQLVGAMPVACAACPADRTIGPGAGQRFTISLYNTTNAAGWAYYMVQGAPPLTFEMEDDPSGFTSFLFSAVSIEPHASVTLPAWVHVAESAVPGDSLQFHIVRGFGAESPDTCVVTVHVGSSATGVGGATPALLAAHLGSMPNPFSSSTRLQYTVPVGAGDVSLSIYDAAGRHIRTLVRSAPAVGEHAVDWNGLDERNTRVPSGVYFGVLRGRGFTATTKLLLLH